jgi:hypothetical protein
MVYLARSGRVGGEQLVVGASGSGLGIYSCSQRQVLLPRTSSPAAIETAQFRVGKDYEVLALAGKGSGRFA